MKNYLIIIIGILFISSCNINNEENSKPVTNGNALLAKEAKIQHLINTQNKEMPEWTNGFDSKPFFENIFSKILSGQFKNIYNHKNDNTLYTKEDVKKRMITTYKYNKQKNEKDTIQNETTPNISQIKQIFFEEEWVFNENKLSFQKKVIDWMPIRNYWHEGKYKEEDMRRKKIFIIKNQNKSKFSKRIATNYIYKFEFFSEFFFDRIGLDKTEFFKFILQKIKEGKIKTYDPIYLVDKSKREFNIVELKNYAGISLDYIEFADEVDKLIFIEDWYFDEKTFSISKKVKGLGFIADRYNDEWEEKILFFIFF